MIVVQAVVETEDDENDPIEAKSEEILAQLEEKAAEDGTVIVDNNDENFDKVVEELDVTIPDAPAPTPGT